RPAAFLLGEGRDVGADARQALVALPLAGIDAGDRADGRLVAAVHTFQRRRDLAHGGAGARRLDRQRQQIAGAVARRLAQRLQRRHALGLVAALADRLQALHLRLAHLVVVDLEDVDRLLFLELELVDADHDLLAAVDARLLARRRLLDAHLGHAGLDRLG